MKVAPIHRAFQKYPFVVSKIVHTGQHYDTQMSDVFFQQLELPKPDYFLGIGGGSHTQQTARIMLEFEKIIEIEKPDLVIVVGDVNSTLACALVAVKMHIKLAHVEAGLRSGDRSMPEELNRIVTDSIADYLFVTEQSGLDHLLKEGVSSEKLFLVGDVMIDSLVLCRTKANKGTLLTTFGLNPQDYILVTFHRPTNVDTERGLLIILELLEVTAHYKKIIFPIHPRTIHNFTKFGLLERLKKITNLQLLEPQGYLEFLQLMEHAALILTDSGSIQAETTYLKVPCLTFRDTTERPVTTEIGTNFLLKDLNPKTAKIKIEEILQGKSRKGTLPPLWDGHAAERIATILSKLDTKTNPTL